MPIFGSTIGVALGSSGSYNLPTTSSLPGLVFVYNVPTSSNNFTTASVASIEANIFNSNQTGSSGELLFRVASPENNISKGNVIFKIGATGSNNEPRVGVGFNNDETLIKPFEVKSKIDSAEGTEILIRSSRASIGAQQGDSAGSINFVIDSSSFKDITTTGSIARIKTKVNDVPSATQGVNGQLTFAISRDIDTEIDIMDMAYAQGAYSTRYSTVTSHSIEIKDTNPSATVKQNASFVLSNGTNPWVIIRTDDIEDISSNPGGLVQVNNKFGTGSIFLHGPTGEITASNISASGDIIGGNITSNGYGVVSQSGVFTTNEFIVASTPYSVTSSDALAVSASNLGIGTSTPEVRLHMVGEGPQTSQILMQQYNDTADAPDIRTRRYRGTEASPSDVIAGDYLFRFNVHGQDGGSSELYGSMQFDVDSSDQDALNWRIQTRDTTGTNATRLTIDKDGDAIFAGEVSSNTIKNIETTLSSDSATNVDTFATASYNGAIYDYILKDTGVGARAGQFMVAHDDGSVTFTDTSTKHLTDPTIPEITAAINGSNVEVKVTNGNGYTFKAFAKKL